MGDITYEKLKKRVSDELSPRRGKFSGAVADIGRNFRNLGFETAVWLPVKIHSANRGGIDAESYIGYSRIEGRWGLIVRTIERDHESGVFVNQRVRTLESCGDIEMMVNALEKIKELVLRIHEAAAGQVKILDGLGREIDELRNPECGF